MNTVQNKMLRAASTLLATMILLHAPGVLAGPWSKQPGQAYLKMGESIFWADNYVAGDGTVVAGVSHLGLTTAIYAEAGIYGGLQATANLPFYYGRNTFGVTDYIRGGVGDAVIGLQYQPPLPLPLPVSARVELKLPLYSLNTQTFEVPAPGDGQIDLTFWLSVGGSFGRLPLYGFVELGYQHRTEVFLGDAPSPARQYDDGLAIRAQSGYTLFGRYLVGANFSGVIPVGESEITKGYLNLGPFALVTLYQGLAVELSFDVMVFAKSSVRGYGSTVGLSYTFD